MKAPLLILCLSIPLHLFGYYSAFINITPADLRKHPEHRVYVDLMTSWQGKYKFSIPYKDDGHTYWLVVCKEPRPKDQREFRKGVVFSSILPEDIELVVMLHPELIIHPKGSPHISLRITEDIAKRAYVYKDYPHPVEDGGEYYCYDLMSFVEAEKKREELWSTESVPRKEAPDFFKSVEFQLQTGLKRKKIETLLRAEWEWCVSYYWEDSEMVYYGHRTNKEYYLFVLYNWKDTSEERKKRGGFLNHSSDDQELIEPVELRILPVNEKLEPGGTGKSH